MSSFLYELGRACFRARRRVLVAWLAALVLLVGLGVAAMDKFSDKFDIPGAPAAAALTHLQQTFPQVTGVRATMLVVAAPGRTVDDPLIRQGIEGAIADLKQVPLVDSATSPFDEFIKGMINPARDAAMINVSLKRTDSTEITDADRESLQERATAARALMPPGTTVTMGGEAFSIEVPRISAVEAIGVGVALIVLILTFGNVLAGFVPVATAVIGVGLSMAPMLITTRFANLSSTTPMLALMLGLAVGIDYALFIISRHRDQLGHGMEVEESAARSTATAGSAVVFAGLTVVIALVGLCLAGIPFLGAMGIFAAITVAVQVLVGLTLVPAFLGFLGERLRPRHARGEEIDHEQSAARRERSLWSRWVRLVTRFPILTIVIVLVGLGGLSVPAKDMRLSLPNSGQHQAGAPDRITYDLIEEHFGKGYNGPLIVTADIIHSTDPLRLVADLKSEVERIPGVASVPVATPNMNADTAFLQVIPTGGPTDDSTKELVQALRDKQPDWQQRFGTETAVTGVTAIQIDISDKLAAALLPFGIFVVGFSLILLTMVFRSIAVPIKATIGYLLSVGVAFGATAMVFSYGWFGGLINLEKPQPVISFYPILLMGILFGLAMDYEVFLVSRMREDYVHGDPRDPKRAAKAVHTGFIGSAKVVTAAAVIMFAVFAFFVPNGEGPIKPIAFGLAVGVAVDAFIVRMTLVPAVLALLGDKAWWLPRWLDQRLPSFDVEGEALEHMLSLRNWPHPGCTDVLRAEGFGVRDHHGPLAAPADLHLAPGQVLVLEGQPEVRSPLLFGLAGRTRSVDGRVKVAGSVLPEEAGKVRRRVALIDARHPDGTPAHASIRGDLAAALDDKKVELIMIDGADAVGDHDERAAIASLIEEIGAGERRPGVILGVADIEVVADLAPRGFDSFTLAEPSQDSRELVVSNGKQEL